MNKWTLTLLILTLFVSLFTPEGLAQNTAILPVEYEEGDTIKHVEEDIIYKQLGYHPNVPDNKTWSFTFNDSINPATITPISLFVLDSKGNKVDSLIINDNQQTVTVLPPPNHYLEDETYSIYFTSQLQSNSGVPLLNSYQMTFSISNSKQTFSDHENEGKYMISMKSSIAKTYNEKLNELKEGFDIVKINEKQQYYELPMRFNSEQPFIYTPNSFYVRIKEMMIRMYTPPVYY